MPHSNPDNIRRINKKLSNDVKTVYGEDGEEVHQQVTSNTHIVDTTDEYPAFMQSRLGDLHFRTENISVARGMAMALIGAAAFGGVVASLVTGLALATGLGLAVASIATGCGLISLTHFGTKSAMARAQKEESGVAEALASYYRAKFLTVAGLANDSQPPGKLPPAASLQDAFAARTDPKNAVEDKKSPAPAGVDTLKPGL